MPAFFSSLLARAGTFSFANLTIKQKLSWVIGAIILLSSLLSGFLLTSYIAKAILEEEGKLLLIRTDGLSDRISLFEAQSSQQVEASTKLLLSTFGTIKTKPDQPYTCGVYTMDTMGSNDVTISGNTMLLDTFSNIMKSPSTIFYKATDGNFVRVSTTVTDKDGARMMCSTLDRNSAAFKALSEDKPYTGPAVIGGVTYLGHYEPISFRTSTIGAGFVGLDTNVGMATLKTAIKATKIGEKGYVTVIDTKTGTALVHPSMEGKSLLELKDADGNLFVKEMIAKKRGVIKYAWLDENKSKRTKLAAYATNEAMGWLVISGDYADNFLGVVSNIRLILLLVSGLSTAILVLVLLVLVTRTVGMPLHKFATSVETLSSGTGDLTQRINTGSRDELSEVAAHFNGFLGFLQRLVSNVKGEAARVTESTTALSSVVTRTTHQINQQYDAAQQAAAAVEEMSVSISSVAEQALVVQATANGAEAKATAGAQDVASLTTTLSKAEQTIGQMTQAMSGFIKQVSLITNITHEMKDIADQTNLLALNAAIEAARAGEQGRGFAVVADEVRKLASRAAGCASQINGITNDLNSGSSVVVSQVAKSESDIKSSVELMEHLTRVFTEISAAINETSAQVEEIAHNMREQASATQLIATSVEQVSNLSEEAKQQIDQVNRIAAQLDELGKTVQKEMSNFVV